MPMPQWETRPTRASSIMHTSPIRWRWIRTESRGSSPRSTSPPATISGSTSTRTAQSGARREQRPGTRPGRACSGRGHRQGQEEEGQGRGGEQQSGARPDGPGRAPRRWWTRPSRSARGQARARRGCALAQSRRAHSRAGAAEGCHRDAAPQARASTALSLDLAAPTPAPAPPQAKPPPQPAPVKVAVATPPPDRPAASAQPPVTHTAPAPVVHQTPAPVEAAAPSHGEPRVVEHNNRVIAYVTAGLAVGSLAVGGLYYSKASQNQSDLTSQIRPGTPSSKHSSSNKRRTRASHSRGSSPASSWPA